MRDLQVLYDTRFKAGAVGKHRGAEPAGAAQLGHVRPESASAEQALAAMRVRHRAMRFRVHAGGFAGRELAGNVHGGDSATLPCRQTVRRPRRTCQWRQRTS